MPQGTGVGTSRGLGPEQLQNRVVALDVARGLAVAGMVFVNNPGDPEHVLGPFEHAPWNGWTVTDLVFPMFVFIMGASAWFSLERRLQESKSVRHVLFGLLRRGLLLVLIGWLLAWFPFGMGHLSTLRLTGVLVRLGITYVLGGAAILFIRSARAQWLLLGAIACVHTAILMLPDYGRTPDDNVQRAIDQVVLGQHAYSKEPTDPEGLLSTLTAVVTMLTGVQAGRLLKSQASIGEKRTRLIIIGVIGIIAGEALGYLIPINKRLWTVSYVLLTSGFTAALLGVLLRLPQELGGLAVIFRPFRTFGVNPIAAFVITGLATRILLYFEVGTLPSAMSLRDYLSQHGLAFLESAYLRSHVYALVYVLLAYVVLRALERRAVYIRL